MGKHLFCMRSFADHTLQISDNRILQSDKIQRAHMMCPKCSQTMLFVKIKPHSFVQTKLFRREGGEKIHPVLASFSTNHFLNLRGSYSSRPGDLNVAFQPLFFQSENVWRAAIILGFRQAILPFSSPSLGSLCSCRIRICIRYCQTDCVSGIVVCLVRLGYSLRP